MNEDLKLVSRWVIFIGVSGAVAFLPLIGIANDNLGDFVTLFLLGPSLFYAALSSVTKIQAFRIIGLIGALGYIVGFATLLKWNEPVAFVSAIGSLVLTASFEWLAPSRVKEKEPAPGDLENVLTALGALVVAGRLIANAFARR